MLDLRAKQSFTGLVDTVNRYMMKEYVPIRMWKKGSRQTEKAMAILLKALKQVGVQFKEVSVVVGTNKVQVLIHREGVKEDTFGKNFILCRRFCDGLETS
eukprot:TRINITY_DN20646_c0_g1_i1.p1 TRINITY_DN20646_c0_g1~~TRINITY_DN20646_c0_g1_i1.p1  ORF type:complete len:100 (-),score=11.92 TRINITY_DN20646_c0_g1_i1:193-492(-)